MTCIAFDGKELVSDSRMTLGDMASPSPFKKIYTPEEGEYWEVNGIRAIAFGVAGDAMAVHYLREKLREGITYKTKVENDDLMSHTIIIDENRTAWIWRFAEVKRPEISKYELLPVLPPVAVGSGEPYAYAVMTIGKNARAAVETAMRLDINSGGDLQIFKVPPKPETPSVRPKVTEPEIPVPHPTEEKKDVKEPK